MARKDIVINDKIFKTKKSALEFYKNILNKYEPGSSLDDDDFLHIVDLVNYQPASAYEDEVLPAPEENGEVMEIDDVFVDFHPVFKKAKCFFVVFGEEEWLFSYILSINGDLSPERKFYIACRNSVKGALHGFKEEIFKNKPVKCPISKQFLTWENCHIDHKSPMTFSVIVKTFIESRKVDIYEIELKYENYLWQFENEETNNEFLEYHNNLAILRAISVEENLKLSSKARLTLGKNDHKLKTL